MIAKCFPLVAGALVLSGCVIETTPAGPTQHETRSVDLGEAKEVAVNLKMGAGELRVDGGAPSLMQADFTYNVPSWKPDVRYSTSGTRGDLSVQQNGSGGHVGNTEYKWNLRLQENVPLDLRVNFGAGESRLNLGNLDLRSVVVEMGVGELRMDLRGNPKQSYNVRIRGGVGEATVYLPASVGIYAKADGGIGGIKVRGLRQEGQHWLNDAYTSAKTQIRLDVSGGVGAINLIAE